MSAEISKDELLKQLNEGKLKNADLTTALTKAGGEKKDKDGKPNGTFLSVFVELVETTKVEELAATLVKIAGNLKPEEWQHLIDNQKFAGENRLLHRLVQLGMKKDDLVKVVDTLKFEADELKELAKDQNDNGNTALMEAVALGKKDLVNVLLSGALVKEFNADDKVSYLKKTNKAGLNALHLAAQKTDAVSAAALIEAMPKDKRAEYVELEVDTLGSAVHMALTPPAKEAKTKPSESETHALLYVLLNAVEEKTVKEKIMKMPQTQADADSTLEKRLEKDDKAEAKDKSPTLKLLKAYITDPKNFLEEGKKLFDAEVKKVKASSDEGIMAKASDWVKNHQTETKVAVGVTAGVAAIALAVGITGVVLTLGYAVGLAATAAGAILMNPIMLGVMATIAVIGIGMAMYGGLELRKANANTKPAMITTNSHSTLAELGGSENKSADLTVDFGNGFGETPAASAQNVDALASTSKLGEDLAAVEALDVTLSV